MALVLLKAASYWPMAFLPAWKLSLALVAGVAPPFGMSFAGRPLVPLSLLAGAAKLAVRPLLPGAVAASLASLLSVGRKSRSDLLLAFGAAGAAILLALLAGAQKSGAAVSLLSLLILSSPWEVYPFFLILLSSAERRMRKKRGN